MKVGPIWLWAVDWKMPAGFFMGPERSSSKSWVFLDEGGADLALGRGLENTSGVHPFAFMGA